MSTAVTGEADTVFVALREAFERAAAAGHVVMTIVDGGPIRPTAYHRSAIHVDTSQIS